MVWGYTPRQIQAFSVIAERRHREELAAQLMLMRVAMHGEKDDYVKQLRQLQGEGDNA